ncbi:MAG: hypothetical protein JW910_13825, partial [Anaerolineae bacterium]|nr:hypothetical protein [Anaerolineae bacterium]
KPLIPVLWRPAKIHFQLSRIQYIDFTRQDYHKALEQLRVEIQRKSAPGARKPARAVAAAAPPPAVPKPARISPPGPSRTARALKWVLLGIPRLLLWELPKLVLKFFGALLNAIPGMFKLRRLALLLLVAFVVLIWLAGSAWGLLPSIPFLEFGYQPKDNPADVMQDLFTAWEDKDMDLLVRLTCTGGSNPDPREAWEGVFWDAQSFDFSNLHFTVESEYPSSARMRVEGDLMTRSSGGANSSYYEDIFNLYKRPDEWCVDMF